MSRRPTHTTLETSDQNPCCYQHHLRGRHGRFGPMPAGRALIKTRVRDADRVPAHRRDKTRWQSESDSNPRSLSRGCRLILGEEKGPEVNQGGLETPSLFTGGPAVRIRLPPARSPLRNLMPTISAQPAEVADPPPKTLSPLQHRCGTGLGRAPLAGSVYQLSVPSPVAMRIILTALCRRSASRLGFRVASWHLNLAPSTIDFRVIAQSGFELALDV
jgi:hypothetical protein